MSKLVNVKLRMCRWSCHIPLIYIYTIYINDEWIAIAYIYLYIPTIYHINLKGIIY